MSNPLIRKLASVEDLTDDDRSALEHLCSRSRRVPAHSDIIAHGERPSDVHLVVEGFAIRYKIMPEGKRQIVGVLLPGDFCNLHVAILGEMDHALATVTPCTIVDIPASAIRDLTDTRPRIIRAFWWATLVEEGTLREWLANNGQREAVKRMAHFFCEMRLRLQSVGLADEDGYSFPLTQIDLGDLFGLSSVHINRSMQILRDMDLVSLKKRRLKINDVARLEQFCSFDAAYLHLRRRGNRKMQ